MLGVLCIEIFCYFAVYDFKLCLYCNSRWENVLDAVILVLSLAGCAVYIIEWKTHNAALESSDNLSILALRVLFLYLSCVILCCMCCLLCFCLV